MHPVGFILDTFFPKCKFLSKNHIFPIFSYEIKPDDISNILIYDNYATHKKGENL